jgi:hypothetical protein
MAADKAKQMDAAVQMRIRDMYGLNSPGDRQVSRVREKVESVLDFIHPKPGPTNPTAMGYVITRGIQAGGLTAAGYGLMKLTEQFGGAADQQEPGQLSLSEEEQETYNKIKMFQGAVIGGGAAALGYKAGEMYRNRKLP